MSNLFKLLSRRFTNINAHIGVILLPIRGVVAFNGRICAIIIVDYREGGSVSNISTKHLTIRRNCSRDD